MRLSYERYFLVLGILIVVGLLVSFEVAAILGVLTVIFASAWLRRRPTAQCPHCGAEMPGSATACERCGGEL